MSGRRRCRGDLTATASGFEVRPSSYERCETANPSNPPASWTRASVSGTSSTSSIPSTTSKGVWYYAVRGVAANGTKGAFSNRAAITRFNETVSGTTYNSYHTTYKDSGGVKRVNGFNRGSSSRWLVFNNGNGANNKSANVPGGSKMFASPSSWNVADNNGGFGPYITTVESPNSSFLPQDNIAMSTVCMVISGGCN